MTGSFRLYAGVAVLASVVIVLTVVGSRAGAPGDGFQWPPDYTVNRIAVVGSDARIRTYSPDGTGELLITPDDGVFTWPTWSPNGRDIAYSRVTRDAQGQQFIALDSYDRISQEYSVVHQGDPGFAGLLAEGVVHYPLWSPDSKKLAFVVVTQSHGLSLYLSDRTTDDDPRYLLDSGPLWMSWSSDSGHLAVHRGGQHFLVTIDDDPKAKSLWLEPSDGYRVPAWRPGHDVIAASSPVGTLAHGVYTVPVWPVDNKVDIKAAAVGGQNTAFLWSSDGSHLAVADDARLALYGRTPVLVYRGLRILDGVSFQETVRVDQNVLAYFWSPDGSRIAFAALRGPGRGLGWTLLDVATGAIEELVDFIPSPDQMTVFQFFDQYAYSHQPWSPDSRYLVFAGILRDRAVDAGLRSQSASRVYVLDTGPMRTIEVLAPGILAFWSPV